MPPPTLDETSIDEVLDAVHNVALNPERYEELCQTWEDVLWPKISDGAAAQFESKVVSHFIRAEAVLEQIDQRSTDTAALEITEYLDDVSAAAAILIGADLRIAAINPLGAQVLSAHIGTPLSELPVGPEDLDPVMDQVEQLLQQPEGSDAILRVRRQDSERLIVFQLRALRTKAGARFVAAITSDIHWPKSYGDILSSAFGLSNAECDIVRLIVDCKSVNDIADLRGRSVGTVRNQIKSILAKTGSRNQIELVRLVMSVMEVTTTFDRAVAEHPPAHMLVDAQDPPVEQRFAIGEDGRKLAYLILGDPGGSPVFYLQTELGLSLLPRFVEKEARHRGLRVISPIRAGFGQSDKVPDNANFCTQIATDLLTVMDHEGIASLPVISMAADNAFAGRMHMLRPGSVSAIIATSGCFPFISDRQAERQLHMHRLMHSTARYFPQLLPYVAKASFRAVRALGKKRFVEKLFAKSPADLAIFQHPEVQEAVLEGSNVALSDAHSGHETFIRQCLSYHEPLNLELLPAVQGQVPYHSLNGLQDPSMPPETLAENQARYPWIEFHIYPDAGQWLFFQYPREVFDLAEQYVTR